MSLIPEQLVRSRQRDLIAEADARRLAGALVRLRRAERRARRSAAAARARSAAAQDASLQAALVAHRAPV